jgi:hypothetical protein
MDNLGSHKGKGVRRLIRAAGAKLFFRPRYSPDLNPIEQVFAKLKTLLRKTDPRTIKTTWRGIGDLIDRFTPTGMRQLPRQCRICFSLTRSRSRSSGLAPGCYSRRPSAAAGERGASSRGLPALTPRHGAHRPRPNRWFLCWLREAAPPGWDVPLDSSLFRGYR